MVIVKKRKHTKGEVKQMKYVKMVEKIGWLW